MCIYLFVLLVSYNHVNNINLKKKEILSCFTKFDGYVADTPKFESIVAFKIKKMCSVKYVPGCLLPLPF